MRKRKGNILVYVLAILCVAIYTFFFGETEEPFVPHYYTWNGRDIFYESKPNQAYSDQDHYVLAVTQIPHAAQSPRDKPSEPFGNEAKNFIQATLRSRDIYLEHLENSPYVYVWLDAPGDSSDVKSIEWRMLNAQLISRGYSKYLPSKAPAATINPAYNEVFLSLQKEAQARHAGIWSVPKDSPEKRGQSSISVYLGENRVIFDPNDNDDEEQTSRPSGRKSSKAAVKAPAQQTAKGSGNVVITPKGKKYHYSWCRTVRGSYTALTVAQARKRGYKPCKVCSPPSH